MNRRIIVIDDEESIQNAYRQILAPGDGELMALQADAARLETVLFGSDSSPKVWEAYEITSALQGQEGYQKIKEGVEQGQPYAWLSLMSGCRRDGTECRPPA